jgi:hypothetical protein
MTTFTDDADAPPQQLALVSPMLLYLVDVLLENGARPEISDLLLDALREIEDGFFEKEEALSN